MRYLERWWHDYNTHTNISSLVLSKHIKSVEDTLLKIETMETAILTIILISIVIFLLLLIGETGR